MTPTAEGPERDRRYCGVAKRQGEGTCTRPAGWGTPHPGIGACKLHGGSTQSHLVAARRDMAAAAVVTYGLPRDIDPQAALLEEVHRTAGHVAWLSAVVANVDKGDLVWGMTKEKEGGDDRGTTFEARPSIWLALYQSERKHLTEVCRVAISAGIEERRVRLAESQGALLAGVIERITSALYAALVKALGPHAAARALIEALWAQWVTEIVPEQLRAVMDDDDEGKAQ